jgi:NAD(P)-dependent dehydrogenase (short-subunit alcohol dehydrogenase family)
MLWRAVANTGGDPSTLDRTYIATPELLAGQIAFLASDESASITGHALVADYGGTAHTTWAV